MLARHRRFLAGDPGETRLFVIETALMSAGSVGYWLTEHQGEGVHEMVWMMLLESWRQGIASRGTAAVLNVLRR